MKRVLAVCVAALFLAAAASALAQGTGKPPAKEQAGKATGKTLSAGGTVSAVTNDSLTIKAKSGEMTFAVDSETRVVGRGMGTKSAELKGEKKPSVFSEYVKVGDTVTVRYHDMGTTKHAASVRVQRAAPK
jgi:hypothetical protein